MTDDHVPTSQSLGRPFMATHGRTKTDVDLLALESIVGLTRVTLSRRDTLTFERRRIVEEMTGDLSIAEVSATLRIPMLTSQVLVSEMVNEGLLNVQARATTDLTIGAFSDIRAKIASL